MAPLLDSPLVGERSGELARGAGDERVLVLGIGNLLMGDEGVGVHVLRALAAREAIAGARLLDGGTGGVNLLLEFGAAKDIILVDATRDGRPAGTLAYQRPERVGDLPRGLSAHDFGLKDLFAAAALIGRMPRLHLYTVSVEEVRPMCLELSGPVAAAVPALTGVVHAHAAALAEAISHAHAP